MAKKKGQNGITSEILKEQAVKMLNDRGITLRDVAEIAYQIQSRHSPELTIEECMHHLEKVLEKREVLHTIMVGYALDTLAEKSCYLILYKS